MVIDRTIAEAQAAAPAEAAVSGRRDHPAAWPPNYVQLLWRHKRTGGLYRVLHHAEREVDGMTVVVYRALLDGRTWARPAYEFYDGRFEPQPGDSELDREYRSARSRFRSMWLLHVEKPLNACSPGEKLAFNWGFYGGWDACADRGGPAAPTRGWMDAVKPEHLRELASMAQDPRLSAAEREAVRALADVLSEQQR